MVSLLHKCETQEVVNISWLFCVESQEVQSMLHQDSTSCIPLK